MIKALILFLGLLSPGVSSAAEFSPSLIGGQPAEKGAFPEVVYITSGSARCSATVIGPRVILTAAHCVANGGSIRQVQFVVDQIVFNAKCENAPLYGSHEDKDLNLCKTDRDIVGIKFASVASKGPALGEQALLTGYGCINPRRPDGSGGNGGNDGILRVGLAKVIALPSFSNDWFKTEDSVTLCFGDSGGPAFLKMADPKSDAHYIIGVNSQGDIQRMGLMTALWAPNSQSFLKDFASKQGVEICGINKKCVASADPKPEQPPKKKCLKYKEKADKYMAKYNQCQKVAEYLDTMEFIEGEDE